MVMDDVLWYLWRYPLSPIWAVADSLRLETAVVSVELDEAKRLGLIVERSINGYPHARLTDDGQAWLDSLRTGGQFTIPV